MRFRILLLSFAVAASPCIMPAKSASPVYPMTYAGGNLHLNHNKVRAVVGTNDVTFIQGDQRIALPLVNITGISYGQAAHRRLLLAHWGQAEDYYIGVTWKTDAANAAQAQLLMKLSRADYTEFLSTLERMTGLKAVDTNQVPTAVHYQL